MSAQQRAAQGLWDHLAGLPGVHVVTPDSPLRTTLLAVAAAVLALVGALGLAACPRVREAVLDTQSPRVACAADAQRCHDGAPEVCSAAGRWWPALPPRDDGSPRVCAGACVVSDAGIAHCAPEVTP